jgi:hypothetical protein
MTAGCMVISTSAPRIVLGAVLALAALGGPMASAVRAESAADVTANVERARRHFLAGKQAFEAKNYAAAFHEFETGYAIEPRAGFLLNMGHALRRLGDQRRALDLYTRFLATDPPQAERRVAAKLVADLQREQPADAQAASPATKSASVSAAPAATAAPSLTLAPEPAAGSASATLSLVDVAPPGEAAPRGADGSGAGPIYRRWWFWAGAGGLAAGVATAILMGTLGAGSSARDSGTWGQIRL